MICAQRQVVINSSKNYQRIAGIITADGKLLDPVYVGLSQYKCQNMAQMCRTSPLKISRDNISTS